MALTKSEIGAVMNFYGPGGDTPLPTDTGIYTHTPLPTSTNPCVNDGDVTGDMQLLSDDALWCFNIVLSLEPPAQPYTQTQTCAADCNGDGQVLSDDALLIFEEVLSLGGSCVD